MDATTTAQEKLLYLAGGVIPQEQLIDWAGGDPGMFVFMIDTLTDSKFYDQNPGTYASLPEGYTIMLYWQKNRLKYLDDAGNVQYIEGQAHLYQRQVVTNPADPTNPYWQLNDVTGTTGLGPPAGF